MGEEAPWREVTPDDYLRETTALTTQVQNALLSAQHQGRFRLRLILRESRDLKHGSRYRVDRTASPWTMELIEEGPSLAT